MSEPESEAIRGIDTAPITTLLDAAEYHQDRNPRLSEAIYTYLTAARHFKCDTGPGKSGLHHELCVAQAEEEGESHHG